MVHLKQYGSEREFLEGVAMGKRIGTRKEVWDGVALKTAGNLKKNGLIRVGKRTFISKARREATNTNLLFKAHTLPKRGSGRKRSARSAPRGFLTVKPEF